ncbi:unnamed protein product [Cochlearia groenlandica]
MIRAGRIGSVCREERTVYDKSVCEWPLIDDDEWDHKGRNMISHIYISYDEIIRSIQFGYLENESLVLSSKMGYSDSDNFKALRLDEDEYVKGLSGTSELAGGISNLTVYTNRRKYGPFGQVFKYESDTTNVAIRDRREFGGFFGSFCPYGVTSIGMYLSPITSTSTEYQKSNKKK